MSCTNCRFENPAENTYCGRCGAALGHEPVPRYDDRRHSIKREVVILTGGVALLLASALFAFLLFFNPGLPENTVRGFIEADRTGNLSAENQYVTAGAGSRFMLSMMQTIRGAAGASPFQNYRILRTYGSAESKMVDVEVTFTGAAAGTAPGAWRKYQLTFFLVRENGEWRIDAGQTAAGLSGMLMAMGMQQLQGGLFGPNGGFAIPAPAVPPQLIPPGMTAPQPAPKSGSGLL